MGKTCSGEMDRANESGAQTREVRQGRIPLITPGWTAELEVPRVGRIPRFLKQCSQTWGGLSGWKCKTEVTSQCLNPSPYKTTPPCTFPPTVHSWPPHLSTPPKFCAIKIPANHNAADLSVHLERKTVDQCNWLLMNDLLHTRTSYKKQ